MEGCERQGNGRNGRNGRNGSNEKKKIWKEKDPVKRAELEEALKTDSIAIKLREIYGRVLADIKKGK